MGIRAPRRHQIAAVALARKLTVLCWQLLTKREDYLWGRPPLVANKTRAMQLQTGHPQQKGSRRGPAYAYNIKALRDREMVIAAQAEQSYKRFVVIRLAILALTRMWNGPGCKIFLLLNKG
ncbi:hypothetical protein ABIB00_007730 [Bradyrhizobium sp. LB14.3]|uniref:hypothetical protein n=1 Tax=Bradyrhizobium sp. LB14.3 TaxID=3156328 RepID=UPI0033944E95